MGYRAVGWLSWKQSYRSQRCRMVGVEVTSKPPQPQTCYELGAPHQLRLPRALSSLALGISRDGAPTALQGSRAG